MAAVLLAMILLPASAGAAEEAASSGDLYAITEKGVGPFEDAGPNGAEKDVIEWVGETCSTKLLHVGLYLPPGTAEKRVEIASDTSDSCNLSSGEIEARREAAQTATTDAEPPAATTDEPLGGAPSTDLDANADSGETLATSSTSTECGETANYVHTSHTIQRGPFMEDIAWLRTTHHRAWNCASGWWKRLQTARAGGHRSVDFPGPPVWKEHNRSCSPDSASPSCSTAVDVRLVATSCLPDEKYRIYTKVTTRSDGSQFVDTYRHGFCAGQSSSTGSKVNSSANDDYGGRSDDLRASPNPVTPPDEGQVVKPHPEPDPPTPTPVLTAEGDWNFQPSGVWNGKKIYISPAAHDFGGRADNEGCNGYKESAGARSIAMEAAGILAKRGFHVRVGTKDRSTNVDNSNAWGADAHIPLHSNAGASNCNDPYDYTKGGSMVLHNGVRTALAARILESLDPESPGSQKILCRGDVVGCSANAPLGEVIRPTGEVAYVEIAFHTFGPDEQWLRGVVSGRARPAEALARGVSEYYFPAPSIQPAAQFADSSGTGRWTVNVGQDGNRQTTLKMEYGDGTYETAPIPQGSGTSTFSFFHTFKGGSTFGAATGAAPATEAEPSGTSRDVSSPNGTGAYAQTATVVDTERATVASTITTAKEEPFPLRQPVVIWPSTQRTSSTGHASYAVEVPLEVEEGALNFEFGDGTSATQAVPAALFPEHDSHLRSLEIPRAFSQTHILWFTHHFAQEDTEAVVTQRATVVKTRQSATSLTIVAAGADLPGVDLTPQWAELSRSTPPAFVTPHGVPGSPFAYTFPCYFEYTIAVMRDPTRTQTLLVDFGDGATTTRSIPPGTGAALVSVGHFFTPFGVYIQRATVMETGKEAYAITVHPVNA